MKRISNCSVLCDFLVSLCVPWTLVRYKNDSHRCSPFYNAFLFDRKAFVPFGSYIDVLEEDEYEK